MVLSRGFPTTNSKVIIAAFSDHLPNVFEVVESVPSMCSQPASFSRLIEPSTASLFSEHFQENFKHADFFNLKNEEMPEAFSKFCSTSLDFVAPLKPRKARGKVSAHPWLNDQTRSRKAERKWKKDKLQVSYNCLTACLASFQKAVKEAKSAFLSNLIAENANRPQMLFKTIDSVLNSLPAPFPSPSAYVPPLCDLVTGSLTCFQPVSSGEFADIVAKAKSSSCELDVILSCLFKEVFLTL